MTRLYMPVLAIHVMVAVIGLGSILSVALVASAVRAAGRVSADASAWLAPLLRLSSISLGVMLVTGVLIDVVSGGAFHDHWWFRGSALLLVITGVLHGQARRLMKRRLERDTEREAALRDIERLAYGMSGLIAAIALLMEAKPF